MSQCTAYTEPADHAWPRLSSITAQLCSFHQLWCLCWFLNPLKNVIALQKEKTPTSPRACISWFHERHSRCWCSCRPPWQHGWSEPQGPCWSGPYTSRTPLCTSAVRCRKKHKHQLLIPLCKNQSAAGVRGRLTLLVMSLTFFMCCWWGVS